MDFNHAVADWLFSVEAYAVAARVTRSFLFLQSLLDRFAVEGRAELAVAQLLWLFAEDGRVEVPVETGSQQSAAKLRLERSAEEHLHYAQFDPYRPIK